MQRLCYEAVYSCTPSSYSYRYTFSLIHEWKPRLPTTRTVPCSHNCIRYLQTCRPFQSTGYCLIYDIMCIASPSTKQSMQWLVNSEGLPCEIDKDFNIATYIQRLAIQLLGEVIHLALYLAIIFTFHVSTTKGIR